jgi:sugar phosphate isomerase/epimerase
VLFHVTARHDVQNCGMYNEEIRQALQEFLPSVATRCEELGVKIHFAVMGHPDHVFFLLVEADDLAPVCALLSAVPMKQEFDIKPVRWLSHL